MASPEAVLSKERSGRGSFVPGPWVRVGAIVGSLAVWAGLLARFGPDERGLISACLAVVLVVLAAYDLEQGRIPNAIVLPAIGLVLIAQLALFGDDALEWLVAGIGCAALLWLPAVFRSDAVGMGDVKLAALIGVGLGGQAVNALFMGSLAAVPMALYLLITRGSDARSDVIPLGPFLALGAIAALFLGEFPGG